MCCLLCNVMHKSEYFWFNDAVKQLWNRKVIWKMHFIFWQHKRRKRAVLFSIVTRLTNNGTEPKILMLLCDKTWDGSVHRLRFKIKWLFITDFSEVHKYIKSLFLMILTLLFIAVFSIIKSTTSQNAICSDDAILGSRLFCFHCL